MMSANKENAMKWEAPKFEIVEVCAEASGYLYRR